MKHFLHVSHLLRTVSPTADCAGRAVTTGAVLACMLWLGARPWSDGAHATVVLPGQSPRVELACANGAEDGQAVTTFGGVKINVEAYNKKREKDIADASVKLLSLAIALQSDLEQHPGLKPSAEAVKKAKAIEKLAHDVKESMKLNIIGPR